MAITQVDPVEVHVRTSWLTGRPKDVQWGERRLPVTGISFVREETAAYPVATGPRITFSVTTPEARLMLAFRHRGRRWSLVGVDEVVNRAA